MPEEVFNSTEVLKAIEELEDYMLNEHTVRNRNYNIMQISVEKEEVDAEVVQRLLVVCVHDSTTIKYTTTIINIISAVISKVQNGKYDCNLVPSAMAILNIIKSIGLLNNVDSLMTLSFQTLLSFSLNTLETAVEQYEEIIEIFNLYCTMRIPQPVRAQALIFLNKTLKIMTPEKRKVFVEKGIGVWFSKVIPLYMVHLLATDDDADVSIETLELLTDELVHFHYTDNPSWQSLLESICNTKQYPAMMLKHLNNNFENWHRLWIVFIRLLKDQLLMTVGSIGTPINSILPVVESAFKMDVPNRCKAFDCWNALIDNFSTETNENTIHKRLKLLVIPLRSNNAKAEATAIAKFKCWWHLIYKFQNKMDKFLDNILISFLQFCFGKPTEKSSTESRVPGMFTDSVKKYCNQALVDMLGHVNCDGCTELPKLDTKLISTKHLVDYWSHWIYSLTSVIMRSKNNGLTKQQLTCLWKSFLATIGELPENNIRKDLFSEALSVVSCIVKQCNNNNQFLDTAFNALVISLFDEDTKIQQLLKSTQGANDPIVNVVKILADTPSLHEYYKSLSTTELMKKFKKFTNLIFKQDMCTPNHLSTHILAALPHDDYALIFWNALVESMSDAGYEKCTLVLHNILIWPLPHIQKFSQVVIPAMTWYTIFVLTYPKLHKVFIDKEISIVLHSSNTMEANNSSVYFKLCVVLGVLKCRFSASNGVDCNEEITLLMILTKSIDNYDNFENIFPILVDQMVVIMSVVTTNVNKTVAAQSLVCVKNILNVLNHACTQQSNVFPQIMMMGQLLKPLETLFAIDAYSELIIPAMTRHLLKCFKLLVGYPTTQIIILSVMKIILMKTDVSDPIYHKVKYLISDIEDGKHEKKFTEENTEDTKFIAPELKETLKQTKKKEPNIVNTVVDNGEEYVVVKSNWKFNPRKLTENQKEKLLRKREDIPALYQDLSQSQDEFKLVSWKTDSQDTTSSSKSESNSYKPDSTEILKHLPKTNVVPKILENLFSEKEKNENGVKDSTSKDNTSEKEVATPTVKNAKLPRMALKDRVFRNVRNLIENSALQKENKESAEEPNKADNKTKTPTHTKSNSPVTIIKSVPPLLSAERPLRVKRKPKKFADLELLTSKRRRHSIHNVNPNKAHSAGAPLIHSEYYQSDDSQESSISNTEIPHSVENIQSKTCDIDDEIIKINENKISGVQQITNLDPDCIMINVDLNIDKCRDIKEKEITTSVSKTFRCINDENTSTSAEDTDKIILSKALDGELIAKVSKDVTQIMPYSPEQNYMVETPPTKINNIRNEIEKEVATPVISKYFIGVSAKSPLKTYKPVKAVETPKSPNPVKEASTPSMSKDLKEVSTLKTYKSAKVVSSPSPSKIATEVCSKDPKESCTPAMSKDIQEASTPKSSKPMKEVSTPSMPKDIQETSTPKSSKLMKEVSTPRMSKDIQEASSRKSTKPIEEVSTPSTSKSVQEASLPKSTKPMKEVSTSSMSKDIQETSTPKSSKFMKEVSTPSMFKDIQEASTPKSTKPIKEVSTPSTSKGIQEASTAKSTIPMKEMSTPSMSKDIQETSTPKSSKPMKKMSTPSTSKGIQEASTTKSTTKSITEVSTPSMSKDIQEASTRKSTTKPIKEVSTPSMSKDIQETSTPKSSKPMKEMSTPSTSKGIQEASTPKSTKPIKEVSTPSMSKDIQEASTCKSTKPIKEVSTPSTSKIATEVYSNDANETCTTTMSKEIKEESPIKSKDVMVMFPVPRCHIEFKDSVALNGAKDLEEVSDKKSAVVKEVLTSKLSKDNKEAATSKQSKDISKIFTPKQPPKDQEQKSTSKKRKSRIEKELAIDMVEGHPFLKIDTSKRLTRKALESVSTGRRKSLAIKLNMSKSEVMNIAKTDRRSKEKTNERENTSHTSVVVCESQDRNSEQKEQESFSEDLPYSEDVIESSQDSTITTISVKSTRKTPVKVPVICVKKLVSPENQNSDINVSQSILDPVIIDAHKSPRAHDETKDDSVLPLNKTALDQKSQDDLTENMDTEPMDDNDVSDVIFTNNELPVVTISTDDAVVGPETQEIAEADTLSIGLSNFSTDLKDFMEIDETQEKIDVVKPALSYVYNVTDTGCNVEEQSIVYTVNNTENNITVTLSDSACANLKQSDGVSSPYKDEVQRQKDFMNNTIEISPIKTMSPDRNKKSPSPETSSDYVVITLSSPVHSNGEPFNKCGSPEVFTEDKVSPDKRDQSPPRVEITVTNSSPSSSLSLKKNRPQVRSGGRAAQMLGLCVPGNVQAIVNPERNETEEVRKGNTTITPARRNLRILYNTVSDNTESSNSASENDDNDSMNNFLKFRRSLPAVDSSPSVPILKRKLAEITDETMISPASKRKRVSFHDPPVSTTISVAKYIEPGLIRSPQNSAQKRIERQLRSSASMKSPKRLDNVFKLDTVLTKAVESFSENDIIPISNETQQCSLDETPVVELIRASELNDTDPICPELLDCTDSIEKIASELSSSVMKSLLIKELEGKIETIGDLAKMTELEVNRLCIKAPKVKVAKKVLGEYALKWAEKAQSEMTVILDEAQFSEPMIDLEVKGKDIEVQTDRNLSMEMEVQTMEIPTRMIAAQTDAVSITHTSIQTDESGSKSTADIIKLCLTEKPDFVEQLSMHLEETSIKHLNERLSLETATDVLLKKITPSDTMSIVNRLLENNSSNNRSNELSLLRDYLCDRFESKDLILLCSQILKLVHDKPV